MNRDMSHQDGGEALSTLRGRGGLVAGNALPIREIMVRAPSDNINDRDARGGGALVSYPLRQRVEYSVHLGCHE